MGSIAHLVRRWPGAQRCRRCRCCCWRQRPHCQATLHGDLQMDYIPRLRPEPESVTTGTVEINVSGQYGTIGAAWSCGTNFEINATTLASPALAPFGTRCYLGYLDSITVRRQLNQALSCGVYDTAGALMPSASCTSVGLIRSSTPAAVCATTGPAAESLATTKCQTMIGGTTITDTGGSCDADGNLSKVMVFVDCGPGGRFQLKPWKIEWKRIDVTPKP